MYCTVLSSASSSLIKPPFLHCIACTHMTPFPRVMVCVVSSTNIPRRSGGDLGYVQWAWRKLAGGRWTKQWVSRDLKVCAVTFYVAFSLTQLQSEFLFIFGSSLHPRQCTCTHQRFKMLHNVVLVIDGANARLDNIHNNDGQKSKTVDSTSARIRW